MSAPEDERVRAARVRVAAEHNNNARNFATQFTGNHLGDDGEMIDSLLAYIDERAAADVYSCEKPPYADLGDAS